MHSWINMTKIYIYEIYWYVYLRARAGCASLIVIIYPQRFHKDHRGGWIPCAFPDFFNVHTWTHSLHISQANSNFKTLDLVKWGLKSDSWVSSPKCSVAVVYHRQFPNLLVSFRDVQCPSYSPQYSFLYPPCSCSIINVLRICIRHYSLLYNASH